MPTTSSTKVGGVNLSPAQMERLKAVYAHPEFRRTRIAITTYKSNDPGLALFRSQASHRLLELAARGVIRRKLNAPLKAYVDSWMRDGNPMFRECFKALNEALGYQFIDLT